MDRNSRTMIAVVLLTYALGASGGGVAAAIDEPALDRAFQSLVTYDWGENSEALRLIDDALIASYGDRQARKGLEKRLIAVLKSDATLPAKQFACRKLGMIGSANCIPAAAALLTDKDLSHMARYVLQRVPHPAAVAALREALREVQGELKVGIINSLGVRRDEKSSAALIPLLDDSDARIVAAAAAALGRIGNAGAARALARFKRQAPEPLRGVASDAYLELAGVLLRKGNMAFAARIYGELDSEREPKRVRLAALRGLIAARPIQAIPRLAEALSGRDEEERRQAIQSMVEASGEAPTKAYGRLLRRLPPVGQVALLEVLRLRKDPTARPAVVEAVRSAEESVRVAALEALGTIGNASDVMVLAEKAAVGDAAEKVAARASLGRIQGDNVNATIVWAMERAERSIRVELLRSLGGRKAKEATVAVLKHAEHPYPEVRMTALEALRFLANARETPVLVRVLKTARDGQERSAAENALLAACDRGGERCADAIVAGFPGGDTPSCCALLRALGRAGGARALQAVVTATRVQVPEIRDEAVQLLSEWPDVAALPHLLEIARTAQHTSQQELALRGYIRLAREASESDEAKAKMLAEALQLARRLEEKKLALDALANVRTVESLKFVVSYLDEPSLAEEAASAAVRIAAAEKVQRESEDMVRGTLTEILERIKDRKIRSQAENILNRLGN